MISYVNPLPLVLLRNISYSIKHILNRENISKATMCLTVLHTDTHLLIIVGGETTPNLCSMCAHTLSHFERMPGAAEFEDQYNVILSAPFDIISHNPLNP